MKKTIVVIVIFLSATFSSCDYLDVVPDNVATLDNAFAMRTQAERYLFTCYSYIPTQFSFAENPAWLAGDEMWLNSPINFSQSSYPSWYIAQGLQNANNPLNDFWAGDLWNGIRDCNIFLENIEKVPDMDEVEKMRWAAEVKFLKAFYHFYLFRLYGPIPLIDENTDVFADPASIIVDRRPVDECESYIIKLLNEAEPDLVDDTAPNAVEEDGRISKLVLYAMKAKMLVTFASPLFNGNADYPNFKSSDDKPFFNTTYSEVKWQNAVDACEQAVNFAESHGRKLYKWAPPGNASFVPQESTVNQMSLRGAVTEMDDNPELIWSNHRSRASQSIQATFTVRSYNPAWVANYAPSGYMAPTRNIASLFYSKNGVPINEDVEYKYPERFNLRTVPSGNSEYQYNLIPGYTTIEFNFDREDRYYASLSFDGGRYYMAENASDAQAFETNYKLGGNAAATNTPISYSGTGYTAKKMVNYENVLGASNKYTVKTYSFPAMRLADLYLLYAEALNEVGRTEDSHLYVDKVRERSGLNGVVESWEDFSNDPSKPSNKEGMRKIIQQERGIELAFEAQRFWDIRRWKIAQQTYNENINGWDIYQGDPQTYYRTVNLYKRTFNLRDYFWPISVSQLQRSQGLVQNPGW